MPGFNRSLFEMRVGRSLWFAITIVAVLVAGTDPARAGTPPSRTGETIDSLHQQIRTAEEQIGTLTGMLDDLRREIRAADSSSQSLREKTVQLTRENGRLQEQLALLAKERDAALQELETVRTESAEAKALAERMQAENSSQASRAQQAREADRIAAQRMQAQFLAQGRRLKEAEAALAAREGARLPEVRSAKESGESSLKPTTPQNPAAKNAARLQVEDSIPPVCFATSNARLSGDYSRVLAAMKKILTESPGARFTLTGHASQEGSEETNLRFSACRAESLAQFLTTRGIPRERITVVASGALHPIADASNPAEDRKNRRVEILVER
ncbi:MAG: OmpA family protein [Verrucomicrobiales bacterium]|nr:OmpA family protein [Verrucomicrobiales bacterium]